jgi:hypothetical protein
VTFPDTPALGKHASTYQRPREGRASIPSRTWPAPYSSFTQPVSSYLRVDINGSRAATQLRRARRVINHLARSGPVRGEGG